MKDVAILLIGLLLTMIWTLILYTLKPKLEIVGVELAKNKLSITIRNNSRKSAVNLRIEVCAVNCCYTYHFDVDRNDFLIIPAKRCEIDTAYYRVFKITSLSKSAKKYIKYAKLVDKLKSKSEKTTLRVRVHAYHEYSGFGKAFERSFIWGNGKFEPII